MQLLRKVLATFAASILFTTCGLDESYLLPSIPESNVRMESSNIRARVVLDFKDASSYYYFSGFRLYYRIYISDAFVTAAVDTLEVMNEINPSLRSNYSNLYPYTDVTGTTVNTSNIANVFAGQKFYELELEKAKIDNVLSTSALGRTMYLDTSGKIPTLEFGSPATSSYNLIRSTGEGRFKPLPENKYFINTAELCDSDNARDPEINADVANTTTDKEFPDRYTYAAFYIIVTGINQDNFTPIYSSPTFVGILRLPGE